MVGYMYSKVHGHMGAWLDGCMLGSSNTWLHEWGKDSESKLLFLCVFSRMFPSPGLPCHYPADPSWGCEVCVLPWYTELHTQSTEPHLLASSPWRGYLHLPEVWWASTLSLFSHILGMEVSGKDIFLVDWRAMALKHLRESWPKVTG